MVVGDVSDGNDGEVVNGLEIVFVGLGWLKGCSAAEVRTKVRGVNVEGVLAEGGGRIGDVC